MKIRLIFLAFCLTGLLLSAASAAGPLAQTGVAPPGVYGPAAPLADDPGPPAETVKLIFIHHSCGENWLTDGDGDLGLELTNANYFVSDTNYTWGPPDADLGYENIGDHTDIGHWYNWFAGPNHITYTQALYTEYGNHSYYTRGTDPDPGRENQIVIFKSCYPNSHLGGNPTDPPTTGDNPLRGQDAWSEYHTVANAKGIYNDLLTYFATRQDKLFVVITAPALMESETDATHATNARAFNDWLVDDWLDGYAYDNVAVWDFYNVLTSNGGDADTNDLGSETGNHHRWWNGAVQHIQTASNNYSSYPGGNGGGSHPTSAGNQKATGEFIELLNVYYNRWQGGAQPPPSLTLTTPNGGESWTVGSQHPIQWTTSGTVAQVNLAYSTDGFVTSDTIASALDNAGSYNWTIPDDPSTSVRVRVESTISPTSVYDDSDADFSIQPAGTFSTTIYLPIVRRNFALEPLDGLVQPGDLTYLGAFRLPGGDEPPQTFAYGGNAMTFNPDNNSLFITGHDRVAYGAVPDGDQVAEISIPTPAIAADPGALPQASFIQSFQDVTEGFFTNLEEIPKVGLQYLNHPVTGPLIHIAWGQHLQPEDEPSHAWFNATLDAPQFTGVWFIGQQNLYSTNGYMFDIPAAWADAHVGGRPLATGRMRDGGQGGMGPTIFAYRPWLPDGSAPPSGSRLQEITLLLYENSDSTEEIIRCLDGYQHPDEWEGGAWLSASSGKTAVLFAGTKSTGAKYWYGYIHPDGPDEPCVDAHVSDFVTCRLANGDPCPPEDLIGCCDENLGTCVSYRGWWSTRFDAQFIFYDPADLARVAAAELESWQPQPYATLDIDEYLYLDPPEWDLISLGWGDQRRARIGDAAYDPATGRLYVLELYADGGKPVVHVWQVQ